MSKYQRALDLEEEAGGLEESTYILLEHLRVNVFLWHMTIALLIFVVSSLQYIKVKTHRFKAWIVCNASNTLSLQFFWKTSAISLQHRHSLAVGIGWQLRHAHQASTATSTTSASSVGSSMSGMGSNWYGYSSKPSCSRCWSFCSDKSPSNDEELNESLH